MRCVYVLCVSGCQPLRWCCVTAAVQPLELAAHNDTLDILMMPARVHYYWRCLPPPLQPGSVLMYTHSLSAHNWPLHRHSISKCLLPRNKLMLMSTFSNTLIEKERNKKVRNSFGKAHTFEFEHLFFPLFIFVFWYVKLRFHMWNLCQKGLMF